MIGSQRFDPLYVDIVKTFDDVLLETCSLRTEPNGNDVIEFFRENLHKVITAIVPRRDEN